MRDQSFTRLFDRRTLKGWGSENANASLLENAYAEAKNIINTHQSPKLPSSAEVSMEEIVREFESKTGIARRVN
jgi:hypothetical protein